MGREPRRRRGEAPAQGPWQEDTHWSLKKLQCEFQVSRKCLHRGKSGRHEPFRKIVPSPGPCLPPDKDTLQQEIKALKNTHRALDEEIAQLRAEGYSLEELESHIALLHEYNEIKDAGQMLLGRLALIRGVTTKELYPEFGLDLTD